MNEELILLNQCLNSEGEADNGTVKFVYMDDSTVYRFENNRMKKVSKTLINKAKKLNNQQNVEQNVDKSSKRTKSIKSSQCSATHKSIKSKQVIQQQEDEEEDYVLQQQDEEQDYVLQQQEDESNQSIPLSARNSTNIKKCAEIAKPIRSKSKKAIDSSNNNAYSFDINDYYDNKYKLEYMNREVERLNNKVERLRQYKKLVNKLSGVDYDEPAYDSSIPQQSLQSNRRTTNSSVSSKYNDSLFLY